MWASPVESVPSGTERMPRLLHDCQPLAHLVLMEGYRHIRLSEATINVFNIVIMRQQAKAAKSTNSSNSHSTPTPVTASPDSQSKRSSAESSPAGARTKTRPMGPRALKRPSPTAPQDATASTPPGSRRTLIRRKSSEAAAIDPTPSSSSGPREGNATKHKSGLSLVL
jgi:hypothetical protein